MRLAALLSVSLLLVPSACEVRALEPASAIQGKLVICGGGTLPEEITRRFIELAGGPNARIVVIPTASEAADYPNNSWFLDTWRRNGANNVTLLHTRDRRLANDPKFVKPLESATGIWLGGGKQDRLVAAYLGTKVEKLMHDLLARGGVIGGTSSGAAVMSPVMIVQGRTVADVGRGFGFLPGSVIDQHFLKRNRQQRLMGVLDDHPGLFGLGIDEGTAVVVEGRRLSVIGASQVAVCFSPSSDRPARSELLAAGKQADLVALSRAAIARATPPSSSGDPATPQVPGGTLVIVGGGSTPPAAVEQFVEAAGGPEAPMVVVTTALGDEAPEETAAVEFLTKAGAKKVHCIHARDHAEAEHPEVLSALAEACGIWFTGGRQWRLVDAYQGTKAERLFRKVLERGGVIGGSSAGATIQGGYLVRGNPLGNAEMMVEGYEQGFGFLPGVAIDQHFSQRKRFDDMLALKRAKPKLLGLGIDESTAVVVRGHEMKVLGENNVAVYDRQPDRAAEETPFQILKAGDRYDLKSRQAITTLLASKSDEEESDEAAADTETPEKSGETAGGGN
jgi:cyanophycinase